MNDGIPTLEGGFTISNPKDIISDQLPKLKNFHTQLGVISTLSASDAYDGDTSDVADGASTLALMVSQSVTSMKQVAKIGEDFEDDWINFIAITFVTGLLYILGIGEAAEGADMTVLASTLRIIGEAGDVGISAYDIVSSEYGGPTAIFPALLGGIGALDMIKAPSYLSQAATVRNGMTAEHFATLGPEMKGGMAQVDKMKANCFQACGLMVRNSDSFGSMRLSSWN